MLLPVGTRIWVPSTVVPRTVSVTAPVGEVAPGKVLVTVTRNVTGLPK